MTAGDKLLQRSAVAEVAKTVTGLTGKKEFTQDSPLEGMDNAFLPSVDEVCIYGLDESGMTARYLDKLREMENQYGKGVVAAQLLKNQFGDAHGYGWQREVDVTTIDESPAYYCNMLERISRLMESKIASANKDDQAHYQSLLLMLKAVKK